MKHFESKHTWLLYILGLFALLNLYANYAFNALLELISKPFLVLILGIYFFLNTRDIQKSYKRTLVNLTLIALIFSWLGDVILLFQHQNSLFFLLGLASFLIAHVFYILAFKKSMYNAKFGQPTEAKTILIRAIPFIGTGILMLTFLYSWLDKAMLVAVPVYVLVILTMAFIAMERAGKVIKASAEYVFFGAFLFMVSDCVLAIDAFVRSLTIPYASVWVMLTYIAAQMLIVYGLLIQTKSNLD